MQTLQVPDSSIYCAAELAKVLRNTGNRDAQLIADVFDDIDGIERDFAQSNVEQRGHLIVLMHEKLSKILELAQAAAIDQDEVRNYFYEDIGCLSPRSHNQRSLPENSQNDLVKLVPIIALFDEMLVEKLALFEFFEKKYSR